VGADLGTRRLCGGRGAREQGDEQEKVGQTSNIRAWLR
jgi:hypothetical protein